MIFPSLPLYLDPPNNFTQAQQTHQQPAATTSDDQQPLPPVSLTGPGPTRPISMTERARLAKIPQPESALSCPRCHSNNTKFCYFNNYSLTQPRHFCKSCRRYWTRGGTLRNIPAGGGCRRNKRNGKSSSLTSSTPSFPLLGPAVPWSQLLEDGYAGRGFEQWRLGYVETSMAAAGTNDYREGEWSVGGRNSGIGQVLGFDNSSSMGNGSA